MVHYLIGGLWPECGPRLSDPDAIADQFNVPRFLEEFQRTGAGWLIFTIGQNTGYYASPNALLDTWAGAGHCTRRDLVGEIAQGVHRMGKRFIAYLPCEVNANATLHGAFKWNNTHGTDQATFQPQYTQFLREWAQRWGKHLDGWWLDGCYTWPEFHHSKMNWPLWYEALRAGNPDALVTFNDGSFCTGIERPIQNDFDYTPGEVEILVDGAIRFGRSADDPQYLPTTRFVQGTVCQWHALVPIDAFWAHGTFTEQMAEACSHISPRFKLVKAAHPGPMEEPVYSDQELRTFLQNVRSVGGVATLNVGIYQEGHLGPSTIAQLQRIGNGLN